MKWSCASWHRVYWFLLSEKIGNCKQRQDQNMANSMIVVLVNVLQFREVRLTCKVPCLSYPKIL